MVEMRVRQKDGVQFIGIFNDRFPVLRRFSTLLNKSAVDESVNYVKAPFKKQGELE